MAVWRDLAPPEAGVASLLSSAMTIVEERHPDLLWPVEDGRQVIVSDYSGQHRQATYEVYSFLVTTWPTLGSWLPHLAKFREAFLPDGRRLSFKQLREPVRRRSYPHFLEVVGGMPGNLITVMIDNRAGFLAPGGPRETASTFDDCFPSTASPASIEKTFRLALLVALLQAGMRAETQTSLWISDHDETLDSFDKREGFGRLATYLTFGLTGWQNAAQQDFLTTETKGVPWWVEDLAAIPDIAAGACAQLSSTLPLFHDSPTWTKGVVAPRNRDWRAAAFADWLSSPHGDLRHVLLRLAPDKTGQLRASAQKFIRFGKGWVRPKRD